MKSAVHVAAIAGLVAVLSASAAAEVKHPFILWTREEAAALRKRIETDPVAKEQYDRMASGPIAKGNRTLWNLFNYLVMGDAEAGAREKKALLGFIGRKPEGLMMVGKELKWTIGGPSRGDRHMRDEQTLNTLRYDVLYDELTRDERRGVEKAMRAYIDFHLSGHKPWHPDFRYDRTSWLPNMHWPRAIGTHLMAVALRDEKAIDAMFNAQGGWKWFFDEYIADGRFYMEEFGKYYSNIGTMLMYCEALERLGLGRYGYGYTGKGGATMRKYLEMPLWIGFPRQERPGGTARYETVEMGDAGRLQLVVGYSADGKGGNRWWSNAHMNGPLPKLGLPGWFEIGHRRWPDAGFDYFLAQLRKPGEDRYLPSLYWGLGPIDPEKVDPPPAPSYVSRERGFAFLRAEESPAYWESPKPAVALQFGMYYVHYVHDCFSILGYQAHHRMIYHRMGRPPGRKGYAGGDPWKDHVRGHCGVVVDNLKARPVDNGNHGCANQRVREGLAGPARFAAVRAGGIYPDVDQERALLLTDEYLLDLFRLVSDRPRVYDWQVLAYGGIPGIGSKPWVPAEAWPDKKRIAKPHLTNVHVMDPGGRDWAATVVQDASDGRAVGVRVSMLGQKGALVLGSTPPRIEPGQGTSLLVTRTAPTTTFVSLHEPFRKPDEPGLKLSRLEGSDEVVAVSVEGRGEGGPFSDIVAAALGDAAGKPQRITPGRGVLEFVGHAYVRAAGRRVDVSGDVRELRLRVDGKPKLAVNGKAVPAKVTGGMLQYRAEAQ